MNAERMEDFAPLPWRQGDFSADYAVVDANGRRVVYAADAIYPARMKEVSRRIAEAMNGEAGMKQMLADANEYVEYLKDRNLELWAEVEKLKGLVKRMVPCVKFQKNAVGDFQTLMDLIHEAKAALGEE
jgi:hypothetical protein